MARLSRVDWDIIHSRVLSVQADHQLPNLSAGLLWLVLEQFFPAAQDELIEVITDGPDDRGIDALHVTEADGYAEVYLFQAKYRETIGGTDRTINDSEALKLTLFIEELFDRSPHLESCGNFRLREAMQKLWDLQDRGVICRYRIVFCSNDHGLSTSAREILESVSAKHHQVTYEFYDPGDLVRDLGSLGRSRETGYLQVVGKEAFERTDGDVRGVIASIDAKAFVHLIQTADSQTVKRYLFDDNLRVFLGSNGGYNSSIIATATSPDSHLFWYLNNGITITCRNYSYNKGHTNPKIKIEDFQIVNGAQTSHSLLEAFRINSEALDDVVLLVRVYATDRNDIAERVAVATNSQARIQSRDLRANHPIMKKMELAFSERGYFFERKRSMHADKDPGRRIDALKLGQVILSYYLREPDRAKTDSDSIFDQRFTSIFHDRHDMDELCRLMELYKAIEELREEYVSTHGGNMEGGGELQYLIYGHWFALYAARLIITKSGRELPVGKGARSLALEAVSLVARACSQQKAVAHYQMFRSPRTKEKILGEISGKQGDFFELLASLQ